MSSHRPNPADRSRDACPSLIDLAALCEGRLTGEALEHLEAHIARCETCLDLVEGLAIEAREIDEVSRMTIVPAAVLDAAMSLRPADAGIDRSTEIIVASRSSRGLWLLGARRGLAAAAAIAIAVGGYHIGRSLTAPQALASGDGGDAGGVTFGLLELTSSLNDDTGIDGDDDGFGIFTAALKEGQSS